MSEVSVDDIKALMAPGIDPDALQGVIDREEDWLANDPKAGIGQLSGERTQRLWVELGYRDPLHLARATQTGEGFTVVDNGLDVTDDVVLTDPARMERLSGAWTGPAVDVTYTPTDILRVQSVVIELVRLALTDSPYQAESTEGHSYAHAADSYRQRERFARTLQPHHGPGSVKLSSGSTHRITGP